MHTWTWITVGDRAYLTCSLLESWSHGFFTQSWWPTAPASLSSILAPNATAYRVKQVHGNEVLTPTTVKTYQQSGLDPAPTEHGSSTETERPDFPPADGLISDSPHQSLWVASADCTPALIGDVRTGAVAAVHAGWRGTALQIVPAAIRQLQTQGSELSHIRVALGPAIAGAVYQVSTMVAAQVGQTVLANILPKDALADEEISAILDQLLALPDAPILTDDEKGRARLDVRRVNQLQLERLGIGAEQVAIAPQCTFQTPELFFSYRRTREKKVQWSGIVSR